MHVDFIRYAAYLHAENLGIPKIEDDSHLLQVVRSIRFPAFVPDTSRNPAVFGTKTPPTPTR